MVVARSERPIARWTSAGSTLREPGRHTAVTEVVLSGIARLPARHGRVSGKVPMIARGCAQPGPNSTPHTEQEDEPHPGAIPPLHDRDVRRHGMRDTSGRGARRDRQSAAEGVKLAPIFEVDPFWPKPLPNHWVTGSTIGLAVDAQDNGWTIHRPDSVEDNFRAADLTAGEAVDDEVRPGAPSRTAGSDPIGVCYSVAPPILVYDKSASVVKAWGGPVRLARQQPRDHRRSRGQRLAAWKRDERYADPEVHR